MACMLSAKIAKFTSLENLYEYDSNTTNSYVVVYNRSEALALIRQYNLFKKGVEELHCIEVHYSNVVTRCL